MSLAIRKKNNLYRKFFVNNEIKLLSYKYLINNQKVKKNLRCLILLERLLKMPNLYKTRIVNFCLITHRPGWVFRKLHYSRQALKQAATTGLLNGIRKASW